MGTLRNIVDQTYNATDLLGTFSQSLNSFFRFVNGLTDLGDTVDGLGYRVHCRFGRLDRFLGGIVRQYRQLRDQLHRFNCRFQPL